MSEQYLAPANKMLKDKREALRFDKLLASAPELPNYNDPSWDDAWEEYVDFWQQVVTSVTDTGQAEKVIKALEPVQAMKIDYVLARNDMFEMFEDWGLLVGEDNDASDSKYPTTTKVFMLGNPHGDPASAVFVKWVQSKTGSHYSDWMLTSDDVYFHKGAEREVILRVGGVELNNYHPQNDENASICGVVQL